MKFSTNYYSSFEIVLVFYTCTGTYFILCTYYRVADHLTQDTFMFQAIAEEFSDDISEDDINSFCDSDCGNFILDLFNKISADCGFDPGDVN